jgi:hypothetical protein
MVLLRFQYLTWFDAGRDIQPFILNLCFCELRRSFFCLTLPPFLMMYRSTYTYYLPYLSGLCLVVYKLFCTVSYYGLLLCVVLAIATALVKDVNRWPFHLSILETETE